MVMVYRQEMYLLDVLTLVNAFMDNKITKSQLKRKKQKLDREINDWEKAQMRRMV